jgi:hypothetical protein
MPDRLSLRSTLLWVALTFGLAFAMQAPLGGGTSAAESAAKTGVPAVVANAPAAEPDLSLTTNATVPALRDARQPRKRRARKPVRSQTRSVRSVEVAPMLVSAPVSATPTPTATPRDSAPAPQRSTPAPKPKAEPKPAAPKPAPAPDPPTSGEFDTSGDTPSVPTTESSSNSGA